ncbi:MAG: diguanylate cyclase [Alphaproteobacteria bacterium]|nr:diguanylate cyclase [Alphaproteobacteria bacterium]
MRQRFLLGKLILAPALALLILVIVAGGQILSSRDLLSDVRSIDETLAALHINGEALERLHASEIALKLFQAQEEPPSESLRSQLATEANRLRALAPDLAGAASLADSSKAEADLLVELCNLLDHISADPNPRIFREEALHLQAQLNERLKNREQAYHQILAERAANARQESETAIPFAILLTFVGFLAAFITSMVSARGFFASFKNLAEAMRRLARGDPSLADVSAELGREFSEVAEALDLFQRTSHEKQAAVEALAESEEGLKRILDAAPVPLALTSVARGKVVYANKLCHALFQVDGPSEGMDVRNFYTNPDDRDKLIEQIRRHGEVHEYEISMRRADGTDVWVLVSAAPLSYRGESVFVLGYYDITERKALMARLSESEERLRVIVEATPVPLVLTRIADDLLLYVNRHALDLFHVQEGMNVIGSPASDFWVDTAERAKMKDLLIAGGGKLHSLETRLKRYDGGWFWALLSATSTEFKGEPVLLVSVEDVTPRKELEQELRRHATTDFLTGIANRRHFIDMAEREFARAKRYGHSLSVVMLDIDHFKRINDTFGHPTGDKVVRAMAAICQKALREIDHLGRMGGEEFAILLPETGLEKGLQAAERVREAVETTPVELDDGQPPIFFTTSAGVSAMTAKEMGFDQMLSRADRALYAAKKAGRNCVRPAEE